MSLCRLDWRLGRSASGFTRAKSVCNPERLTGIAHILAALAPLYTYSTDGTNIRRLMEEELFSGNFRKGGEVLHFVDGRAPIENIAVPHGNVEEVVRLLNSAVNGEDQKPNMPATAV